MLTSLQSWSAVFIVGFFHANSGSSFSRIKDWNFIFNKTFHHSAFLDCTLRPVEDRDDESTIRLNRPLTDRLAGTRPPFMQATSSDFPLLSTLQPDRLCHSRDVFSHPQPRTHVPQKNTVMSLCGDDGQKYVFKVQSLFFKRTLGQVRFNEEAAATS